MTTSYDPEVAEALGLLGAVDATPESIYPYSPVFRAVIDGRSVVVNRTRRSDPATIAPCGRVALEYQHWEEGSWPAEGSDWSAVGRAVSLTDALCADASRSPL